MFEGVRVVEVATHVFVPSAAAVLSHFGAEVIKIEHPVTGDPYRHLHTATLGVDGRSVNVKIEHSNRGKRSSPGGTEISNKISERGLYPIQNFYSNRLRRRHLGAYLERPGHPRLQYHHLDW